MVRNTGTAQVHFWFFREQISQMYPETYNVQYVLFEY
uniref:Uncharacterized protein n=1 Tax=Anguilla anguilla TaxID=7936 RepID=A0A0E9QXX2_ANGAN